MPTDVSPSASLGYVPMNNAPGADISFDDLFPPEGPPAAQPQAVQGTTPPQPPQATQGPFLRAGETVYNTSEDAVNGITHKDDYIKRARAFLVENGIDPNEFRKVQAEPQAPAPAQSQPSPYKYLGNGKQYYQDLAEAANPAHPNPVRYEEITRQYQQEVFQNQLQSWAPIMAETTRQQAIRKVSAEIPDFQKFYESADFKRTVDSIPIYKEMIDIGESNPEAAKRLPEVYRAVYLTSQGFNRVNATGTPQAPPVPPVQNTPTARPSTTMSPSTMTPPPQGRDTRNWTTDREARKQLIQDYQGRGIQDADWGSLGT